MPTLKPGKASCRKKPTEKAHIQEVDDKALEKSLFIETIEMWGSQWHKFEDIRGWVWTQEAVEEDEDDKEEANTPQQAGEETPGTGT